MKTSHLIQMANNIGDFFAAMPDAEQARRALAAQIHRWEPRMRRSLFEYIDRTRGAGLQSIVLQALRQHRAELR